MITIEQLTEKLGGNLWAKGNLRRIYLDKGWNTKKMSTKTFVWQDEKGEFKVSCRIDCPSQSYQWIKSQEDKVKEDVYEHISEILAETVYIITNKGEYCDDMLKSCTLNDICLKFFYSEEKAEKFIEDEFSSDLSYIEMPKNEFIAEIERLDNLIESISDEN